MEYASSNEVLKLASRQGFKASLEVRSIFSSPLKRG